MGENLVTHLGQCLTIASELVGGNMSLIYYSHIPTVIITLLMGIFVLKAGKGSLQSKIFFSFCIVFSLWIFSSLITWIGTSSVWIMFFWSILTLFDIVFYILGLYFFYVFVDNKDVSFRLKLILIAILTPFLILAPSKLNLPGFDYVNCMAVDTSFMGYIFYAKMLIASWLVVLAGYKYKKATKEERPKIILLSLGLGLFLFSVFITSYIADTYLRYDIELYGLYAMTAFMGILAFLIVKFKAFDIKLLGAQALVWSLNILIASEFIFVVTTVNRILTGITLLLAFIFGYYLILGVKALQEANEQKSEFMSFASHELRSPITAVKGYASMILEGSMGEINPKVNDSLQKIMISSNSVASLITQYLDKSKMELGQLGYILVPFDLGKLIKETVHDFQVNAEQKRITLTTQIEDRAFAIEADEGKIKEVVGNVLDNAIKYTDKGSVTVSLSENSGVLQVKIVDTGVGIPKEIIPQLFKKFSRADAKKANIRGSGLGLFLSNIFITAHKGKIWVESEGDGKGSTFFVELPTKQSVKEIK